MSTSSIIDIEDCCFIGAKLAFKNPHNTKNQFQSTVFDSGGNKNVFLKEISTFLIEKD